MKKLIIVILTVVFSLATTQIIACGKDIWTGVAEKAAVCHKPGTPAEKTLWVPLTAVPWHLAHGDTIGECVGESPE